MFRQLILITTLTIGCLSATAQGIVFQDNPAWADVVAQAEREDKLIFIDCYTTWCGPCKALAREVFPLKEMGDHFNPAFICVKYDMEKGDGKMLNEKYKQHIIGYPTLLFIDKRQEVRQQLAGYQEASVIIAAARKAAEGRDLFTLKKEYEAGQRGTGFLRDYMASLNAAFLKEDAKEVADDYLATHEPQVLDNDTVWEAFGEYVTDPHSAAFDYLVNNAARYGGRLNRNRAAINFQIRSNCDRELRQLLRIRFDSTGTAQPLSTDTLWMEKLTWYLEKASQPGADLNRLYIYIHKQLLHDRPSEAWQAVKVGVGSRISGFYSMKVEDYVNYLLPLTRDKRTLRDYAAVLQSFIDRNGKRDYTVYRTLATINRRLGNRALAEEQQATYDELQQKEMEHFKELFQKSQE